MLKTAETNEKKKTIQKYTQKSSHAFVLVTVHPLGSSKASLITQSFIEIVINILNEFTMHQRKHTQQILHMTLDFIDVYNNDTGLETDLWDKFSQFQQNAGAILKLKQLWDILAERTTKSTERQGLEFNKEGGTRCKLLGVIISYKTENSEDGLLRYRTHALKREKGQEKKNPRTPLNFKSQAKEESSGKNAKEHE